MNLEDKKLLVVGSAPKPIAVDDMGADRLPIYQTIERENETLVTVDLDTQETCPETFNITENGNHTLTMPLFEGETTMYCNKVNVNVDVASGGGTTVTVGGNPVETFDADTKLSKMPSSYGGARLYGRDYQGNDYYPSIAGPWPSVDTIPIRLGKGEVRVGTPTNDDDATTKKYVDDGLAGKMDNNADWVTYLENATFKKPSILSLSLHDSNDAIINGGTYEVGTSFNLITKVKHQESNIANISTLKFKDVVGNKTIDITKSASGATHALAQSIYIDSSTPRSLNFTLTATDTKGNSTSKSVSFSIVYYHYYATSTSSTAPTTGVVRGPQMNGLSLTNGADVSYSQGQYLYWYCHTQTPTTAKLQQYDGAVWFDVDTQYVGEQRLAIGNTNVDYKVFRTPSTFMTSGSAKYRMGV